MMKKHVFFTLLSVCLLGFLGHADAQSKADCFKMQSTKGVKEISVEKFFPDSKGDNELKLFDGIEAVYALSVSMDITRLSESFLVRVLLKDADGRKHLVAESYKEIAPSDKNMLLTDYCEETALLAGVKPVSLLVITDNAEVKLSRVWVSTEESHEPAKGSETYEKRISSLRKQQVLEKVDLINVYNEANNKLWRAGATSLSLMSYSDKMYTMNAKDEANLGGLEYYSGGIFEFGETPSNVSAKPVNKAKVSSRSASPTIPVTSFDWRNRHGKNWMTPVKDQNATPYCVAFAMAGCIEAIIKLYYYDATLNFDLSEQQLACCSFTPTDTAEKEGIPTSNAKMYCQQTGLVLESNYPFNEDAPQICHFDDITYTDIVKVNGFTSVSANNEESIIRALMEKGPLYTEICASSFTHAMVLVGFSSLEVGDYIMDFSQVNSILDIWYPPILNEGDSRVGATCWILKNSWGEDYGNNGYMYLIKNNSFYFQDVSYVTGPITTQNLTEEDRNCIDEDGDGFYFYISPTPSSLPGWGTFLADMDDTDPDVGGLMSYNRFYDINPDHADTLFISYRNYESAVPFSTQHIVINNGGSLVINRDFNFCNGAKLIIRDGGELIVKNGCFVNNIDITMNSGSKLTIKEGATLKMAEGKNFVAPIGAIVDVDSGSIEPY